jgi:GNAT superfamily N-acetyltransferase
MLDIDDLELIEFTDENLFLIDNLANEAQRQGYQFVQRTIDEWNSGVNRFSAPGENLWGLLFKTNLVGIGGLNRDPYSKYPNVGRVRHLYILHAHRRKGYATLLMNTIISRGTGYFNILRLFTDNPPASEFYETLGFKKINGPKVSHVFQISY